MPWKISLYFFINILSFTRNKSCCLVKKKTICVQHHQGLIRRKWPNIIHEPAGSGQINNNTIVYWNPGFEIVKEVGTGINETVWWQTGRQWGNEFELSSTYKIQSQKHEIVKLQAADAKFQFNLTSFLVHRWFRNQAFFYNESLQVQWWLVVRFNLYASLKLIIFRSWKQLWYKPTII